LRRLGLKKAASLDRSSKTDLPRRPLSFEKTQRAKPSEVTLAEGWKSEDRGRCTACIPPTAPVGMDIYEIGAYSAKDRAREPELFISYQFPA
jgi:hypothetical protein